MVIYKEMLAAALPGRPSKQATRLYVTMLRALENVVTDAGLLPLRTSVHLVGIDPELGNFAVLGSQGY